MGHHFGARPKMFEPPIIPERTQPESLIARIRMVSGQVHVCTAVLMFDIKHIRTAQDLKQKIEKNLKADSQGARGSWDQATRVCRARRL